ncbi:MAG: Rhamnan synthesis F [uncultured bacterium]|nr:MAG: Rhamnan synthesis F [uncultured bacterium]OFY32109.1 MAG: hypothetical protein A2X09_15400 [Bacteroidetes bacterium GWF2_43_11]HBR79246.1 phosphoribosyl transferase [Candidatus Moranbacteria bacterium]HCU01349.1 phosphoribosyl transferase [Candidatus Nomurabacteria bacterium]
MTILNFKTYSDLARDIRQSLVDIPNDIDLIVGIPRSGMIPAYMIGAFLNLPVASLDEYLNNIFASHGERPIISKNIIPKKILIVDDSINLGGSIKEAKNKLYNKNPDVECLSFAVYATRGSNKLVDFYAVICEQPRIFQWNYLYHGILSNACFDIDGVLCVDPTSDQNDDGNKYSDFILNAKPLYIPNYRIRALVTSRLEKYRKQTEEWLKKNNVQFDDLYMLDLPTKEERIKQCAHDRFKSRVYSSLDDCFLFVESDRNQAIKIANMTNKPVISLFTDEMFPSSEVEINLGYVDIDIKERLLNAEKDIIRINNSKTFLLGDLFFRSIKSPYKFLMFPINFLRILLRK